RLIDLDVNPQSVLVTGAPSILENISSIRTVPIDITGATETITQPVALDLPEGISIDEDLQSVIASLIIEPINTSGVIRKTPEIRALGEGLTATIQTEEVTIFLFGSIRALDSLSEDDVTVTLDLFNKGIGTHNVIPVININSSEVEYRSFQPEFVTVIIESPPDVRDELEELLGEEIDDENVTGTPTPEGTRSGEDAEDVDAAPAPTSTQTTPAAILPTATPSNYP
ncbi:MAG: CdaR family protein, partial [Chloroflexota bacterium]